MVKKRIRSERGWCSEDSHNLRQSKYEIIPELSGEFPVRLLCESMGIRRNSFCYWKKRLSEPAAKTKMSADSVILFWEYHIKYPSHGYWWLNAKIRPDTGFKVSDTYAHKCCKIAGIKSRSKHYRYKKPDEPHKVYPNLIPAGLKIDGPM